MKLLNKITSLQENRLLWILMIIVTVGLTCVAHYFFQDYLYMQPCEQCVYIRFAMLTMALGGLIVIAYPNDSTRMIGYILGFYGCVIGFGFCITLNNIHEAVHNADAFGGVQGCREIPIYPFALPLHEIAPSWFLPTGDCGLDNPIVPEDAYATLSSIQQFFVGTEAGDFEDGFYSNGWYLIPSIKFMNMAIACLLCFICCFVALSVMFIGYIAKPCKCVKVKAIVVVIAVVLLVVIGNAIKVAQIASSAV